MLQIFYINPSIVFVFVFVFYYLSLDPHRITKSMDMEIVSYNNNKCTSSLKFYYNIIQIQN